SDINISVFHYFRQLAESPERPAIDVVLSGLARVFDADQIGLDAGVSSLSLPTTQAPRTQYPWQTNSDLQSRLHRSLCAETHPDAGAGRWTVATLFGGGAAIGAARRGVDASAAPVLPAQRGAGVAKRAGLCAGGGRGPAAHRRNGGTALAVESAGRSAAVEH